MTDSDDHVVVLRLDDPRCEPYMLQGTGVALWREIDDRRSAEEIARVLAERYGADLAAVRRDVLASLAVLVRTGLLLPGGDGDAAGSPGQ
ncbi:PqqD family protein [Cryobacterium sp. 1639]|uniref:PqqD family protein n=1 Tax=Cryobacterium inferilacus TaxID=2866629 RepID=UPI001C72CED1|nr:PqqD family protein [Cryobacterium sp. 1639]MBX0301320.1 PqqD family protein [Cryobacterium sp. 1639]